MGKLFFVYGPESAGNHVTSKVLQTMGCFWDEPQSLDQVVNGEKEVEEITTNENIVLRRSIPHGVHFVDPDSIRSKFKNHSMITIIPVRDWMPNIFSNYYHRSETVHDALSSLRNAWIHIGNNISNIQPFYFFNTSLLFKDPRSAIEGLEYFTSLEWPENIPYEDIIYDADIGKHQVFRKYGFNIIDRQLIRDHIKKPRPLLLL
jgi:hypothetical protein